ncbi:MAG TPA: permease-like cell division protein FtsX [Acidimicrobiales bacterium]
MPINVDYVARETTSNLGRNISITIASVLTVAVSLALVGGSLMLRTGVENATQRWQGGIEFVIYMNVEASEAQIEAVDQALAENPEVKDRRFFNQEQSKEEFDRLFDDSPEMKDSVEAKDLPPSFRVEPVDKSADSVNALSDTFRDRAGVKDVVVASKTIKIIQDMSRALTLGIFVVAAVLLGAAGLLILNTIRMAMFARRREIEVMKLVGATNWFIRVPFMIEGLVQGLLGAAVAIVTLIAVRPLFEGWLPDSNDIPLVSGFTVSAGDLFSIYVLVGVVGAAVGAIGAGVAVSRYLDV